MDVRIVSWNLCGLSKLHRWPSTVEWLQDHDIVIIQESLQVTRTFHLNDVTRFDFVASETGGRAQGGLIVALANKVFGATRATTLIEENHMLAVEISTATSQLTIVNVYVPVHSSGFSYEMYSTISVQLETLASLYPTSPIIIAGNFFSQAIVRSQLELYIVLFLFPRFPT
jgi:exonuclease III